MTEDEVNEKVKQWLENQGYKYKGILKARNGSENPTGTGYGQVPIPLPSGDRLILIDHQGVKDKPVDLLWVEAKGSSIGMSQLLEGFIRVTCACYWGGGRGLLAIPSMEYEALKEQQGFLTRVSISCDRSVGLLDAETDAVTWLT